MKNTILYIIIALLVGLLVGFLIFDNQSKNSEKSHDQPLESQVENHLWTCSMHPQIMQPEPGDCPICGMELIPAGNEPSGLSPNEIRMTENAMALANIQTIVVGENTNIEEHNTIQLSGKIMSNEESNTVQSSYFEGRIEKLYVNFTGDNVRRGQLLATIYAPSLVNAQQELITIASMKESQPELYLAVRNKLKLWKLTQRQINEIESTQRVKEVFPIYATVSGTVSQKLVEEGDYVAQGQPLLKLNNLNTVWAMFDAYENEISNLKVGDKIIVSTNAYPEKEYEAVISFIDPVLNIDSRTIAVRVNIHNVGRLLKPGMFAVGKVNIEKSKDAHLLQVPASAIMWTGERSLVYIKTKPNEPIFEMREVSVGARYGDMYVISKGLNKGDEVVVNGTFTLDAAAQIQGKKSMMMHNALDPNGMHTQIDKTQLSDAFRSQLSKLFQQYILVKDALVKDDFGDSQKATIKFEEQLRLMNKILLKQEEAQTRWNQMKESLKISLKNMKASQDIAKQRQYFISMSNTMSQVVDWFGVNQTVYQMYCPMANNDKGAYWLSTSKEVLNPYYGASMLKCGEVKKEIPKE